MTSWTKTLAFFMRMTLLVALVFSIVSFSTPMTHAARHATGGVDIAADLEQATMSDHAHESKELEVQGKTASTDCLPDGKKHSGHDKGNSDCCAAMCYDLTIVATSIQLVSVLHPRGLVDAAQALVAVDPIRHLRPPRA